jgi:hypothetical protein
VLFARFGSSRRASRSWNVAARMVDSPRREGEARDAARTATIAWPLFASLAILAVLAWRLRLSVPVLVAMGAAGGAVLRLAALA